MVVWLTGACRHCGARFITPTHKQTHTFHPKQQNKQELIGSAHFRHRRHDTWPRYPHERYQTVRASSVVAEVSEMDHCVRQSP